MGDERMLTKCGLQLIAPRSTLIVVKGEN